MQNRATGVATQATISAIVVDDETLASEELAYLLKEFADVEIVATAANGIEAVKLIEDLEPDLVFLDVQMPGLDGMGVIRKLREKQVPLPYFVMSTAYDQYAVEAFRWEALDYLLKPVEKDRLALAVDRARKGIAERPNRRCSAPKF
jgi:two-component system response regulator LytT